MIEFVTADDARRRLVCEQAAERSGWNAASIEKDFWMCWTLRALVALPDSGPYLTFKGGTSLSKGWKLIARFSEDLDIVIDRARLGFDGECGPDASGISGKERVRRLEALRDSARAFVAAKLVPELGDTVARLGVRGCSVELDPDDGAGQTLLIRYPAACRPHTYLRPIVTVELGARSDVEPTLTASIRSYVAEHLPGVVSDDRFDVRTVAPIRTFWEKVMLLHEENFRASHAGPKDRLSRHYYDLWCMVVRGIGDEALRDAGLFERVAAHRRLFFARSRAAHDSMKRGRLRIVPSEDHREAWSADYAAMREAMFFGEAPPFEHVLAVVSEFEARANGLGA